MIKRTVALRPEIDRALEQMAKASNMDAELYAGVLLAVAVGMYAPEPIAKTLKPQGFYERSAQP